MAKTRAQENRAVRQEALREWLSKKCTAQHLVDNIDKIEALDHTSETFRNELDKYKVANDQRLRVMNKYLPDVRTVELTGEAGEAIQVASTFEFIPVGSNA
ncbi:MAG: hypothetical protein JKY52_09380 [Flavobacteriales bacterium]|nr:hypothetical protein [Flavobacteriales bacterium]